MTAAAQPRDDGGRFLPIPPRLVSRPSWHNIKIDDGDLPPICDDCARQDGLCGKEVCRRAVLPQIAKPVLVKLIGDSLTEQTQRQTGNPSPAEKRAIERIGRRNARKAARSPRRGYFGLAKAIAQAK